jgi:hypothetical protein
MVPFGGKQSSHGPCCTDQTKEGVSMQRQDVEFSAEGGVQLRGWLFTPTGPGLHPAITMAHGSAVVKEHGLERFARLFVDAGFVVLVHDHGVSAPAIERCELDVDGTVRRRIFYGDSLPLVRAWLRPRGLAAVLTRWVRSPAVVRTRLWTCPTRGLRGW